MAAIYALSASIAAVSPAAGQSLPLIPGGDIAAGDGQRMADLLRTPIRVSTIYPGYIVSEGNRPDPRNKLMVSTEKGVASIVRAIERERRDAMVPAWPWVPLGVLMRVAPLGLVARFL